MRKGWAHVGICREVLPRLQGGRDGLKMAKVMGLEWVVVTSTNRSPRFDHFRNTARIRHRKPLAPVPVERLFKNVRVRFGYFVLKKKS